MADYEIYLRGFPKRGIEPTIEGLMRTFGLDVPRAFELLRSLPRVVKQGVREDHRERYEAALRELGADFEVRPTHIEPQRVVAVSLPEPEPPTDRRPARTLPRAVPAPPSTSEPAPGSEPAQPRVTFDHAFPERPTGEQAAPAPTPSLAPPVPPALVGRPAPGQGSTPPIAETLVTTTRTRAETVRESPLPDAHAPTIRDQPAPDGSRADARAPTLRGDPTPSPRERSQTLRESVPAPTAEPTSGELTLKQYGWREGETTPPAAPNAQRASSPNRPGSWPAAPAVAQPRVRPSSHPALHGVRSPVPPVTARSEPPAAPPEDPPAALLALEQAIVAAAASVAPERAARAASPSGRERVPQSGGWIEPEVKRLPSSVWGPVQARGPDEQSSLPPPIEAPPLGVEQAPDALVEEHSFGGRAQALHDAMHAHDAPGPAEDSPAPAQSEAPAAARHSAPPVSSAPRSATVGTHDLGVRSPLGVPVEDPAISPLLRIVLRVALGLSLFVMLTAVRHCRAFGSEVHDTLSTWERPASPL